MSFNNEFINTIKAGIPVLQICTYEWERLQGVCIQIAKEEGKKFFVWSSTQGRKEWDFDTETFGASDENPDSSAVLDWFKDPEQKELILLLEDFHPQLEDSLILRRIRECVRINPRTRKTLIIQTLSFSTMESCWDFLSETRISTMPIVSPCSR